MNIVLLGASLQSGNRGVNALTRSQIVLLLERYKDNANIVILSYTVKKEIINKVNVGGKEFNIKEVPCTNKEILKSYLYSKAFMNNEILSIIRNADFIFDISEGDSFSDIYGEKRFLQHSLLKLIAINSKKKLILMPQTLGPFKNKISKIIAKKILNKSYKVFVRDKLSKNIVENELNIEREVVYSPDMAFAMEPDRSVSIDKFIKRDSDIIIGFNISALLYNGGYNHNNMFGLKIEYKDLIDNVLKEILTMDNVKLILIPHVLTKDYEVEDDFRVCKKIADRFAGKENNKIYILDKHYREDQLKSIISGCDFFIGSRMHACIGAVSTLVPTVALSYSRKFSGIWNELGLGECSLDLTSMEDKNDIITNIKHIFNKRELIKNKLENNIPMIREEVRNVFNCIEEKGNE